MTLQTNKIKSAAETKADEIKRFQQRFDEITEWLIDNPFNHKDWDKHIEEYNALSVKIAILNGDKIQQNNGLNY